MKIQKMLLSIDVVVQLILLIFLAGTILMSVLSMGKTILLTGLIFFFLGLWQLGSGIFFGLIWNDRKRGEYVMNSFIYIWALVILSSFAPLFIIFFLIFPIRTSVWYFQYSKNDLEKLKLEIENWIGKEDILDSDELLERRMILDL